MTATFGARDASDSLSSGRFLVGIPRFLIFCAWPRGLVGPVAGKTLLSVAHVPAAHSGPPDPVDIGPTCPDTQVETPGCLHARSPVFVGELGWILETTPRAAKQRVLRREASNLKLQEACWGQDGEPRGLYKVGQTGLTQTAKQTDGWPGNPCRTCVAVVRLAGWLKV